MIIINILKNIITHYIFGGKRRNNEQYVGKY